MDIQLIIDNLTNPALLFFFFGLIAVQLKSDLEIPPSSSKFISLYLLFAIGFKGGQELAHSTISTEIVWSLVFGMALACVVPLYIFGITKRKLGVYNAGAIAAAYGSVSAVTFVTAISFLETLDVPFGGHMVAVMALMEAPSIIVGVLLIALFNRNTEEAEITSKTNCKTILKHAVTNGSVLLIIGSLIIGFMANDVAAEGIKPFTTDIFKGFLAIFLLDMGITSGKRLRSFLNNGWFTTITAILFPLINGSIVAVASGYITESPGNRFLFAILAAGASYIAVPAAMRLAIPKANPSLYIPMALGITFPINITLGMPIYYAIINM